MDSRSHPGDRLGGGRETEISGLWSVEVGKGEQSAVTQSTT